DRQQGREPCAPGRKKTRRDTIKSWNPSQKENEQYNSHRGEVCAEQPKSKCIKESEPSGVRIAVITVRQLTGQNALGRLGEGAFVVWNPSALEQAPAVDGADQPHHQKNAPPPPERRTFRRRRNRLG